MKLAIVTCPLCIQPFATWHTFEGATAIMPLYLQHIVMTHWDELQKTREAQLEEDRKNNSHLN